jgi:competence protein ComEC
VAADVGQGTAVLVRTARHLLVYDTGPVWSPEADAGQRVLLPLLRGRGEGRVDRLVLSHRDSDHVGGAASLLAGVRVGDVLSSLPDGHPLPGAGVPHVRCDAGQSWTWDGVAFEVLHPTPADHATATRPNAVSCVLRVAAPGRTLLLTGDIEAAQEQALLARGAALRADVLVVPHHGSRTSSTPAFIQAVSPRVAVFQAAYRSRFGHPAPDVVMRYEAAGVKVVRSDRCGAFSRTPDGGTACERQVSRRYWHHGAAAEPAALP